MIFNKETAHKTAESLLQINAIKLNPKNPFTWASGWKSPIYCDNRITLSYPEIRKFLQKEFAKNIVAKYGKPDVIAGVATGAIGIGLLVAEALELPFVYVRPEPKKHGRQNQIEGQLEAGKSVIVIEDLISTGKSSLQAVDALKENGANILGMAAIFTYEFQVAEDNFKNAGIELTTLSNYSSLLENAVNQKYISDSDLDTLQEWRKNPAEWNQ
ncbi:orotate phosphoribosyltransferase [Myroides odoratimimus]|uniref:orotate phosphoribosyltransferase n=1 Tax=Myroides odoratimimus TaxID=76832 RepID=UPI0025760070|nr:orotate phosphoribosyltransferase [Myroides odoratimimus]MDM1499974.1 orotate phosphoribosyltransferase [Myroides odoratimimus]MDM1507541.1 orotate phosphoribosyltransferase [Myroides odoratimimus]MDM1514178.1 orotate phosphoribosyltransferase [Myroides odoratimimus]MDM1517993.1 orotate phosphoribosyltransferase [Myroides odoratimimus]MDM1521291.1 orotate phosphoribosyltransferase [Myroides odoratimimus]